MARCSVEISKMEQRYDAVVAVIRDGFTVTEAAQKLASVDSPSIDGCTL